MTGSKKEDDDKLSFSSSYLEEMDAYNRERGFNYTAESPGDAEGKCKQACKEDCTMLETKPEFYLPTQYSSSDDSDADKKPAAVATKKPTAGGTDLEDTETEEEEDQEGDKFRKGLMGRAAKKRKHNSELAFGESLSPTQPEVKRTKMTETRAAPEVLMMESSQRTAARAGLKPNSKEKPRLVRNKRSNKPKLDKFKQQAKVTSKIATPKQQASPSVAPMEAKIATPKQQSSPFVAPPSEVEELDPIIEEQRQLWDMFQKRKAAKENNDSWKTSSTMGRGTVMRQPDFGTRPRNLSTEESNKEEARKLAHIAKVCLGPKKSTGAKNNVLESIPEDSDEVVVIKTVAASSPTPSVRSPNSASSSFQLTRIKWFQAEFAATRTSIRSNERAISSNGEMIQALKKKQEDMKLTLDSVHGLVKDIHSMLQNCPHKKDEPAKERKSEDPPDSNKDADAGDDDDDSTGGRTDRHRNTRYENHSGRVELNIHNPTVNISTATRVDTGATGIENSVSFSLLILCFSLFFILVSPFLFCQSHL